MTFASTERTALAELLRRKGPDAPTLCQGWDTRDLAAHLFVREHRPGASLLSVLPGRNAVTTEFEAARERPYPELISAWEAGPGGLNPWRVLDPVVNGVEHFIHHEDVRRGGLNSPDQVEVRALGEDHELQLYRALKLFAPRMLRTDSPVILQPTGLPRLVLHDRPGVSADGQAVVRVAGDVGELVLWVSGRDLVRVEIDGDVSRVQRRGL